ncbi:MAG TPA: RloB family protein [Pseudonocardiaceae bacterium]|nr:RloB family protein [Pseudonocardiaceae bacterium]
MDGLRRLYRVVSVRPISYGGSPSQMVEYATKRWDQDRDRFDHVWCVADVDDYREDIDKAVRLASRAKISLVISNPCFEFWLLLHFTNHVAWLNDAAAAVAKVCRHVPSYDKTKLDFDSFAPGIHNAIDRARAITDAGKDHRHNPTTTMWRLATAIVGAG